MNGIDWNSTKLVLGAEDGRLMYVHASDSLNYNWSWTLYNADFIELESGIAGWEDDDCTQIRQVVERLCNRYGIAFESLKKLPLQETLDRIYAKWADEADGFEIKTQDAKKEDKE